MILHDKTKEKTIRMLQQMKCYQCEIEGGNPFYINKVLKILN